MHTSKADPEILFIYDRHSKGLYGWNYLNDFDGLNTIDFTNAILQRS